MSDLFFFEANDTAPPRALNVKEVANYVRTLDYGLKCSFASAEGGI